MAATIRPKAAIPAALGWSGAAIELGIKPSSHRLPTGAQASCPMLGVRRSTYCEVPGAVTLVRELLEVVRIYRLPAGVHRLDDLVLEYQLTRPSPARDQLAQLVNPLVARPDLLQTLRCYLSHGRSRRLTAAERHVQANTVDYRLRQVDKLTGLDPAQAEQLPRLVAALAAHDAS
ncbi:PucR family transcriptional regulator [Kribbella qitaiheensis]|uniref:PucR family transcriptional regulator n=1 Tax=Kribbella qitaiheensis TaxID=1544730 RepID=A0A7G6X2Q5_9ACTN|nr:helix-turn-helix domain-containing protein [Kribbella qitaiheensis]QNE20520.1 PucR family transcriptional regulator [Kribbella qitaiheensis]